MEYNLKDEETLNSIVDLVESSENKDRILKHTTDYQIINGNQREHIRQTLEARYPKTWQDMTIINLKIGEKIIRKLSRVYANGVKREVINRETNQIDDKMTELINYIYSDINQEGEDFNDVLIKVNKYYNTHDYTEVFCYEDKEGYIRIKAIPQHLLTAVPNEDKTLADVIVFKNTITNFSNAKAFIDWNLLATELDNLEIVASYTVWSKDENFSFVRVKGDKKGYDSEVVFKNVITSTDDNPLGINPYGVMPFIALKRATEGHFYPFGSEIPQMSKEANMILCDLVTIAINQGFGQAVIYYEGEAPPREIHTGCTNIISLPNNEGKSRFEFQNANADINGVLNVDQTIIRLLLSTNDLTTDKVSGELQATNFASAIDRIIADSESIENTKTQTKKFINAEQKIFKVILEILKYQVKTQSLPMDYPQVTLADLMRNTKLKVTFNDIRPMITEKEKIDTIKAAEEAGLIMPWEKHLKFNDGMTIEEAKQREEMIHEYLEEMKERVITSQMPKDMMIEEGDDTIEDEGRDSIEENGELENGDQANKDL
jgi:hypothetical protein